MTWVKVCGITRPEHARAAVEAGADAIGVVFAAGSPRRVEFTLAARIAAEVAGTGVELVGVFVDPDPEAIDRTARLAGLTALQLHARPGPPMAQAALELGRRGWTVIRAGPVRGPGDVQQLLAEPGARHLLDGFSPSAAGGTGRPFPWEWARGAWSQGQAVILAGGLSPQNVRQALEVLSPWGVDVSTGVEVPGFKGVKDPERIWEFVAEVRRYDAAVRQRVDDLSASNSSSR